MMLASFMVLSFATQPPGFITGLLLMEIGLTFGQQVGTSGQIRTLLRAKLFCRKIRCRIFLEHSEGIVK